MTSVSSIAPFAMSPLPPSHPIPPSPLLDPLFQFLPLFIHPCSLLLLSSSSSSSSHLSPLAVGASSPLHLESVFISLLLEPPTPTPAAMGHLRHQEEDEEVGQEDEEELEQ